MGLLGILLALAVLMWLAYRGWSVLLAAPATALLAAAFAGAPTLAVSQEREGGSRTGQPQGPVLATAKLIVV